MGVEVNSEDIESSSKGNEPAPISQAPGHSAPDLKERARKYFNMEKGPTRGFSKEKTGEGELFSLPNGISVYRGRGNGPEGYSVIERDEDLKIIILQRKR